MQYEIRLAGHLPRNWTDWFDGFARTVDERGEIVLAGAVPDQQALAGLITAICNMNLTLLSVRRLDRK
ncbi:MAG TPA: hypothetical protein VNT75_19705 [Symbiobacteriaceae bacterium]|nr:hypothetical protein [Symbiobacteriaceae bacterium]